MASALYEKSREDFGNADIDYLVDTINIALLDLNTPDTGIKVVTGASNATPIVITATSHGFANGDIVVIGAVGGNLSGNGLFRIANQATNTFELTDPITGTNVTGSGSYTSGGYAVCLGPSAAGSHWDDFSAAVVGTPQALGSKTNDNGLVDAADPTFTSVTGATVEGVGIYKSTGVESTSRMVAFLDGRQIVTCAATVSAGATTIPVERLIGGIPNSTVLAFSNGQTATLTALANAGDRTVTVSALGGGVTAGNRSDAPVTGAGLPITPNGGNIAISFPSGIFKL